jgi:hypothetical protein
MKAVLASIFLTISMYAQPFEPALENSKTTQALYENFMFSWTAIHGKNRQNVFEVDVIHSPNKTKFSLYLTVKGKRELLSITYIIDGFWYVEEKGKVHKYRLYEAHYAMPTTYSYIMKSKIQFLTKKNAPRLGTCANLTNGKYQFYRKLNDEQKDAIRKKVDYLKNNLIPQAPTRAEEQYYLNEAKKLLYYAKAGKLSEVDKSSGVISKLDLNDGNVEIKNFQWITIPDDKLFKPQGEVVDMTNVADLSKAYLFSYNQQWKPGMYSILTDGRIYLPKDDSLRRIPFPGTISTPYAIDLKKELIYITGIPVNSNHVRPFVINNTTGKCIPLGNSELARGRSSSLALSPNRNKLALLHNPSPTKGDKKNLYLLELNTGQIQKMPLPGLAQKVIWHPDGKSLFVSQLNQKSKKTIISLISPNKFTSDIVEGSFPTILSKTKKLLFLDLKEQKWKTSELDGRNVKLFKDGLSKFQFPASSTSESKLLIILRDEDNQSIPVIYNINTSQYSPVTARPGLWLNPVWNQ